MKYYLTLTIALVASWLFWSGHFRFWEEGFDKWFILILGGLSIAFCIWFSSRMHIVDEEGAPAQLGIRPFTTYLPWLTKEIVQSNVEVTKIIVSPQMPLHRTMIYVHANQQSEIGRVILANSITLTPGTVSVSMEHDTILVHALSFYGAEEDLSGEMDRRVCALEVNGSQSE